MSAAQKTGLVDGFGRLHDSLRLSVTDRCNLRCRYCMPSDVIYQKKKELLTFEELERSVSIAARLGVRKVRVTGGEPLVRSELHKLIRRILRVDGIQQLGLTTNGIRLVRQADQLYAAGLRSLNISLDSLSRDRFKDLTQSDRLEESLAGVEAAQKAGFAAIKINAVAMKGFTEEEIPAFVRFARETNIEVRFIEFMPLDGDGKWQREQVLWGDEILDRISRVHPVKPDPKNDPRAPAKRYLFTDGRGAVGLILSVSQPFCEQCNRVRITADGKIRNCLFGMEEFDIKALIRGGATDEKIVEVFRTAISRKREGHEINTAQFAPPNRVMNAIGG